MIDKIDISNDTHYKERVDRIVEKMNELIESNNFIELKLLNTIEEMSVAIHTLERDIRIIESSMGMLMTNQKNKSINNDVFVRSVLEKVEMLKNMIDSGTGNFVSLHLASVENIEKSIRETNDVSKEQLSELNEIYSNVKTRI